MNASDEDRVKDLDEQSYLSGYNLDADMLVCNELSLYLPMKILCKDDCKGNLQQMWSKSQQRRLRL